MRVPCPHRYSAALSAALLLLNASCLAAEEIAPIGLGGPEIVKLDWNIRSPVAADLDRNGQLDLLLLNSDKTQIELLYRLANGEGPTAVKQPLADGKWHPTLDDSHFQRKTLPTGERMFALAVGDLNGDGRPDLAYTAADFGLRVLFQTEDSQWREGWTHDGDSPSQWSGTLAIGKVIASDQSTTPQLVMLTNDTLLLFELDSAGLPQRVRRYPLSEKNPHGLTLTDANRDGRLDLLYLVRDSRYALKLRLQGADGGFAAEHSLRVDAPRSGLSIASTTGETAPELAMLNARTGTLQTFRMQFQATQGDAREPLPSPVAYGLPQVVSSANAYGVGDLNGDGRTDLVLADADGSAIWLYLQQRSGHFSEPIAYPAFAGTAQLALADVDGDGRAEVFLAAAEDEGFGVTQLTEEGRLAYPQPLEIPGLPLGIQVLATQRDSPLLAAVVKRGKKRGVALADRDEDGRWNEREFIDLAGVKSDPVGTEVLDFDGDGREDLLIYFPRNPARLLLGQPAGTLLPPAKDSGFRAGLLDNLTPGRLTQADLDGDDRDELLIASRGKIRLLRTGDQGEIQVIDQFNTRQRESQVSSAMPWDLDGDERSELLVVSEQDDELEIQRRDDDGVMRYWQSSPFAPLEILDTRILPDASGGPGKLLHLGSSAFLVTTPAGGPAQLTPYLSEIDEYESELEDVQYGELGHADLNGDGQSELVLLDNRKTRMLEVLHGTANERRDLLHFAVFDGNLENTSREPRELLIADLDQDGRDDLILVVHDRVLFYPAL